MAHTHWMYPIDLSGDDEARQAFERQPYFMLKCSKFLGASFMKEVTKKDIPDLTTRGYLYKSDIECPIKGTYYFVLDRHCVYLLGVFSCNTSNGGRFVRNFLPQFEQIREKTDIFLQIEKELTKIHLCVAYQQNVQSLVDNNSNEYKISFELLSIFKQKSDELKIKIDSLRYDIERMIHEFIMMELEILQNSSEKTIGINIEGTAKHYIEYFLSK
jgi:hypothetical protein